MFGLGSEADVLLTHCWQVPPTHARATALTGPRCRMPAPPACLQVPDALLIDRVVGRRSDPGEGGRQLSIVLVLACLLLFAGVSAAATLARQGASCICLSSSVLLISARCCWCFCRSDAGERGKHRAAQFFSQRDRLCPYANLASPAACPPAPPAHPPPPTPILPPHPSQ